MSLAVIFADLLKSILSAISLNLISLSFVISILSLLLFTLFTFTAIPVGAESLAGNIITSPTLQFANSSDTFVTLQKFVLFSLIILTFVALGRVTAFSLYSIILLSSLGISHCELYCIIFSINIAASARVSVSSG